MKSTEFCPNPLKTHNFCEDIKRKKIEFFVKRTDILLNIENHDS